MRARPRLIWISSSFDNPGNGLFTTPPLRLAPTDMNKRPLPVAIIGLLFLVAGIVGLAYHARDFKTQGPFQYDVLWVCFVRFLAIICAIFMFRGANWARWLLLIWITYHVVLSAFHSLSQVIVHGLLLAVIAYFLLDRRASAYFCRAKGEPAQANQSS